MLKAEQERQFIIKAELEAKQAYEDELEIKTGIQIKNLRTPSIKHMFYISIIKK